NNITVCDDDIDRGHRKVQQLALLDLYANRDTFAEQQATAGHNDNDVAGAQRSIGLRFDKLGVALDPLNKHTFRRKGVLQIGDPTIRKSVGKLIRPHVPLLVAGASAGLLGGLRGHLHLELFTLRFQVDAEQSRRKAREKPYDETGPNKVADRVRDS